MTTANRGIVADHLHLSRDNTATAELQEALFQRISEQGASTDQWGSFNLAPVLRKLSRDSVQALCQGLRLKLDGRSVSDKKYLVPLLASYIVKVSLCLCQLT